MKLVPLDLLPEKLTRREEMELAHELFERLRPHAVGERPGPGLRGCPWCLK